MKIIWIIIIAGIINSCEFHEFNEHSLLVPLTVTEDPTLPSISINGTLLHSETYGNPDSTMLVMLHGGPGSDFRSLLKNSAFADDGYFVVFYDQIGSGLSERKNADVFTYKVFIDELDAVIKYYRSSPTQKVVLVGQSWGAILATAYVNDFPDKIAGLILTEPGGFTWQHTKDYINRSQSLELFGEGTNDYVYLDQFLITSDDHNVLDYKAMLRMAADTKVGNAEIPPFWRKGAVCSSASFEYVKNNPFDFTTNLNNYTTKVLFGYSELNSAYGKAHAELVSSAFPNVELIEFKGTGHSIPYFGWEEYYQASLIYLTEIL
ncbi:MAG: alpha/beta hydrolase [Candidatus Marinimicrobia bacterium]|nr:alpha/beta hydrolase [Candidatus Neomarinimicrobiota bacterium]